jgi:hypothetical protein
MKALLLRICPVQEGLRVFPPLEKATVKAIACELPASRDIVPTKLYHISDIQNVIESEGILPMMSKSTISRILEEDMIKPWRSKSWISPRDPKFVKKAQDVLELYEGLWRDKSLGPRDYVISFDEKPGIQALRRIVPMQEPGPDTAVKVEHEYERLGTVQYMAAWDVFRGKVIGKCVPSVTKPVFHSFIEEILNHKPYKKADRIFLLLDGGPCHRGEKHIVEIEKLFPKVIVIDMPKHASWLNQVEIYFSILQRKVLTPNDFGSLLEVVQAITAFEDYYNNNAKPFNWKFTKEKLLKYLKFINFPWAS